MSSGLKNLYDWREFLDIERSRHTICLVNIGNNNLIESKIWAGVSKVACKEDCNLICYLREEKRAGFETEEQYKDLFKLAESKKINGIILWSYLATSFIVVELIKQLCRRLRLPLISVGHVFEDIPSLIIDHYQGMRDITEHLINDHHFTKIAFVRPNHNYLEWEERFKAYLEVMSLRGLFDPDLIITYYSQNQLSFKEISKLFRGSRENQVEAIIAPSDEIALQIIKILHENGIRVPSEVAVVGFDDNEESSYIEPALTTVKLDAEEQGSQAFKLLLKVIEGEKIPEILVLPSKLIIRESCACSSPIITKAIVAENNNHDQDSSTKENAINLQCFQIVLEMAKAFECNDEHSRNILVEWSEKLVENFLNDVRQIQKGQFLNILNQALNQLLIIVEPTSFHNVLSTMRALMRSFFTNTNELLRAENLWQQARLQIAIREKRNLQTISKVHQDTEVALRQLNQTLIAASNLNELKKILGRDLPKLGFNSCYIKNTLDLDEFFNSKQRYSLMIENLYFREKHLGYVIFEGEPVEKIIYYALRGHIISALKEALFVQKLEQTEKELLNTRDGLELEVKARTADLTTTLYKLESAFEGIINAMALTVGTKDAYTARHQSRVSSLAIALGIELSLPEEIIEGIKFASMIHDIGKVAVPSELLGKPSRLADLESSLIKNHTQAGYDILRDIDFPWPIAQIVLQHHERLNGTGYPHNLREEDILIEAKIIAVADVVEAISSHRPYRAALGTEAALDEIIQNKGILYDFYVVEACLQLFRKKNFCFKLE